MFESKYHLEGAEEEVDFMPLIPIEEDDDTAKLLIPDMLPLLPLKNTTLFPGVVIPITISRDKSIKAIREAYAGDKLIGVVSQIDSAIEDPEYKDLNTIGTVARIMKTLKMPDGSTTAIIQGKVRFQTRGLVSDDPYFKVHAEVLGNTKPVPDDKEFKAVIASMKDMAAEVIRLSPNIPTEATIMLKNIESPSFLINFIASNLNIDLKEKQKILEINDLQECATIVIGHLNAEIQMLDLKNKIQNKVRGDIEKQQRDYFLNQQLKTIQEELRRRSVFAGDKSDDGKSVEEKMEQGNF
jgi:ATP-dependent Lon protease